MSTLAKTTIGNPENEIVRMGPLAGMVQRQEVKAQVSRLLASSRIIYGALYVSDDKSGLIYRVSYAR